MKVLKYIVAGSLLIGSAVTAVAQDVKTDVSAITKTILANKDNTKSAEDAVKAFLKVYKKDAEALTGLGRAYLDARDTLNAIKYSEQAIKRDKNNSGAYILRGDIEVIKDDGGSAANWYQKAVDANPNDPQGYVKYAGIYRKVNPAESAEMLERLRSIQPNYPVDAVMGRFYYQATQYADAVESFSKANINSLEEDQLIEFSVAGYFAGNNDKALEVALFGLQKYPRSAVLNRMAFYNNLVKKDYNTAISYADKLINSSDNAKIVGRDYMNLAYSYLGNNDFDNAILNFNKSMELDGRDPETVKALSQAYIGKKDFAKASALYDEYLKSIDKPSVNDYTGLAELYSEQASNSQGAEQIECLKKADAIYAKIFEENPTYKYALYMRANINSNIDQDPDLKQALAKPYYEKLVEMIEAQPELTGNDEAYLKMAYYYMAIYNIKRDNIAKSKEYADKLLRIDPTNETAKQIQSL